MIGRTGIALLWVSWLMALCTSSALAQSQTTGRIAGTVKDPRGALIVGAEVNISSEATTEERKVTTDNQGNFTVALLPSGIYRVRIKASGFNFLLLDSVQVVITETTTVNAELTLGIRLRGLSALPKGRNEAALLPGSARSISCLADNRWPAG